MTQPPFLKQGDTIAIVSTARKITKTELSVAIDFLEQEGYNVVLGKSINAIHYQFAGTDKERAQDFQEVIDNPTIKAIWCARGGYGTVRIIEQINFNSFSVTPKWVIGYSDITVLHSKINGLGLQTLHAPMAFDLGKCTNEVKNNFKNILNGSLPNLQFDSNPNNKIGNTFGKAIGGNLSVIYSLCGSSDQLETKQKILFLEDLDEYLYHIDRMFQNLKRNGYLENLAGLVIGGMTHIHDNSIPFGYTVEEIVLEVTKDYNYPVIFDAPFGHIKDNQPIALGNNYEIIASQKEVIIKPTA